ncbi:hypothetical protein YH65_09575 [Sulfurovum lithotrophicum]|uniref:Uncharacterized protein n=1 Tax=Sulfurovum lithotrophicum TaxID=206403 RepID=A0A7U4M2E4_9BACT|nr:hypothetical protein [Sulfurovum lithotrophicum]AKF25600.1 hypothetical protein YH65_09575 [Sulfurovum lithotrophicum]
MKAISSDFAPPLKLISPFFSYGVVFYLLSMLALLFFEPIFSYAQMNVAGWIHLFLLGFVMMIIFGAMAQLIPVVLEAGHAVVDVYYVIFPLLLVGASLMVFGFWLMPAMLPYGGLLVLVAMIIFAVENIATLKKTTIRTLTVETVAWSNGYLLLGILTGFAIALGLSGDLGIDVTLMLKAHVYAVLGGYVVLTIIGLSLILIPMFSLAHGFEETAINRAFKLVITGVAIVFAGALFAQEWLMYIGYAVNTIGIFFYIWQIYIIAKLTVRKEMDIWAKSMIFAFGALILSIVLGLVYFMSGRESILHASVWFLLLGFISSMITGHLYKIVPFLVWFERFAPLVGKEKVPMLHEMYSKEGASMMFWFTASGVVLGGLGLLFENDILFKGGASFLFAGAIFLFVTMRKMLAYGK